MQREELNFILQYADIKDLESITKKIQESFTLSVIQSPTQQTLMLPVKDPISGGEFYAGEVLVTSSLVCLEAKGKDSKSKEDKFQGWSMVLDDEEELSLNIAIIDAYIGMGLSDEISSCIHKLALSAKEKRECEVKEMNAQVDLTRVNFELM